MKDEFQLYALDKFRNALNNLKARVGLHVRPIGRVSK